MSRAPRRDGIANREKILTAALRALQRDVTAPMAAVAAVREFLTGTVRHGGDLFLPHHGAPPTSDPEFQDLVRRVWDGVGRWSSAVRRTAFRTMTLPGR